MRANLQSHRPIEGWWEIVCDKSPVMVSCIYSNNSWKYLKTGFFANNLTGE